LFYFEAFIYGPFSHVPPTAGWQKTVFATHPPGLQRVLAMVQNREVQAVIVAKLDRLTRSVRDLCELLELFERRGVALISLAESLDTSSAAGRLVINIMAAVSQWEREAIGERTRDALRHKRSQNERGGQYRVWISPGRRRQACRARPWGTNSAGGNRPASCFWGLDA
jgi:DNA invertase Pin-like site-specific DNA recombinase